MSAAVKLGDKKIQVKSVKGFKVDHSAQRHTHRHTVSVTQRHPQVGDKIVIEPGTKREEEATVAGNPKTLGERAGIRKAKAKAPEATPAKPSIVLTTKLRFDHPAGTRVVQVERSLNHIEYLQICHHLYMSITPPLCEARSLLII